MDAANQALERMSGMLAASNVVTLAGRAITELREEINSHDQEYNNIIKTSTKLGAEFVVIENETVSLIKTEEENLTRFLEITDEVEQDDSVTAVQDLLQFYQSFEQRTQNSLRQLEDKKNRVEDLHTRLSEVVADAYLADSKAGKHKQLTSAAPEIGGAGGGVAGAGVAALSAAQIISKFLPALGPVGVAAGITLTAASGLGLGIITGMQTGKTVSGYFKHRSDNFQELINHLVPIQEALIEKMEVLTEVIRLLSTLESSVRDIIDNKDDTAFLEYELRHFLNTSSKAQEQNNSYIAKKASGNMMLTTVAGKKKSWKCSENGACGSTKRGVVDNIDDPQLEQLERLAAETWTETSGT